MEDSKWVENGKRIAEKQKNAPRMNAGLRIQLAKSKPSKFQIQLLIDAFRTAVFCLFLMLFGNSLEAQTIPKIYTKAGQPFPGYIPFAPDSLTDAQYRANVKAEKWFSFVVSPGKRTFFIDHLGRYLPMGGGGGGGGGPVGPTTNLLTATGNNFTSTVNGVTSTVTPATGTPLFGLAFNGSGNLIRFPYVAPSPADSFFLKFADNTRPTLHTQHIWRKEKAAFGGRAQIGNTKVLAVDSSAAGGAVVGAVGNRGGRFGAKSTQNTSFSTFGHEGSNTVVNGVGSAEFVVQEITPAPGSDFSNPTGTFETHFGVNFQSNEVHLNKYPASRDDGKPGNLFFSRDGIGTMGLANIETLKDTLCENQNTLVNLRKIYISQDNGQNESANLVGGTLCHPFKNPWAARNWWVQTGQFLGYQPHFIIIDGWFHYGDPSFKGGNWLYFGPGTATNDPNVANGGFATDIIMDFYFDLVTGKTGDFDKVSLWVGAFEQGGCVWEIADGVTFECHSLSNWGGDPQTQQNTNLDGLFTDSFQPIGSSCRVAGKWQWVSNCPDQTAISGENAQTVIFATCKNNSVLTADIGTVETHTLLTWGTIVTAPSGKNQKISVRLDRNRYSTIFTAGKLATIGNVGGSQSEDCKIDIKIGKTSDGILIVSTIGNGYGYQKSLKLNIEISQFMNTGEYILGPTGGNERGVFGGLNRGFLLDNSSINVKIGQVSCDSINFNGYVHVDAPSGGTQRAFFSLLPEMRKNSVVNFEVGTANTTIPLFRVGNAETGKQFQDSELNILASNAVCVSPPVIVYGNANSPGDVQQTAVIHIDGNFKSTGSTALKIFPSAGFTNIQIDGRYKSNTTIGVFIDTPAGGTIEVAMNNARIVSPALTQSISATSPIQITSSGIFTKQSNSANVTAAGQPILVIPTLF